MCREDKVRTQISQTIFVIKILYKLYAEYLYEVDTLCRKKYAFYIAGEVASRWIFIRATFLPTVDRATGDIYLPAQGCLFVKRLRMKDFLPFIISHVIYGTS